MLSTLVEANAAVTGFGRKGVVVVIEAEHPCMSLRGVQASGVVTVTSASHGLLREDPRSRGEFFALTGHRS